MGFGSQEDWALLPKTRRRKKGCAGRCYSTSESGLFILLLLTQAAMTTVVGVCMLMKHDGMDAAGILEWAFNSTEFPYPLQPVWA